ncbi:T9SS type B sorting domain-containing protein [Salmonirosea aquatica]|uniref:T9SS type B sorting domain-containing protein n=1 Tax=Salmonirosea aquatica TaxID=2654236 RepID=A0A7C9BHQ3_9BACT|nr:T9SS type B sorting domain-containing protein [Cytophagaceae bacterium SJW1-29]
MAYRRINILWVGLLWLGIGELATVRGQDLCQTGGGGFTINFDTGTAPITGCAPFLVTVANTVAGANNIAYNFDYKGEANPSTTTNRTFTYTKPGTYRILQVGSSGATGITACREVIVRDNTPPKVTYSSCPGGKIKLTFADDSTTKQYDQITVDWFDGSPLVYVNTRGSLEIEHTFFGSGTRPVQYKGTYTTNPGSCSGSASTILSVVVNGSKLEAVVISELDARADGTVGLTFGGIEGVESEVLVKTGAGTYAPINVKSSKGGQQQLTLPGLDPKQVHCIKIRSTDACGNFSESNEVCTIVMNGTAENERNLVTWTKYPLPSGFKRYELLRNGIRVKSFDDIDEVSYVDNNLQCGLSYRYQIIAITDKAQSNAVPVEVTVKSDIKPDAVSQAIVSVEQDGSVSLIAFPPAQGTTPSFKMIFERADGPNAGFTEIGETQNGNRYTDGTALTSQQSYCYRILYENACGNRSDPSEPICTVYLKNAGSNIQWTSEAPFTDDVDSYFVIKLNKGGASTETGVGSNTTYNPQFDDPNEQEFNYQVRVRSKNGAFLSYSNVILFRREAALFMPDAFSPNDDGMNDFFKPSGTFYDNFQLVVYNRWGQSIFQTTDAATGWDGMIQGNRAPQGQYVYKVIITDSTGVEFVKSGTVLLLR